jgi:hypothetical protein
VYARAGLESRAVEAFNRSVALSRSSATKTESLKSLALTWRRARRFDAAAAAWRDLLAVPGCPRHIAREANQALAIHHEHRVRDLAVAKAFALQAFDEPHTAWTRSMEYRLKRIEKKMRQSAVSRLTFEDRADVRLET